MSTNPQTENRDNPAADPRATEVKRQKDVLIHKFSRDLLFKDERKLYDARLDYLDKLEGRLKVGLPCPPLADIVMSELDLTKPETTSAQT